MALTLYIRQCHAERDLETVADCTASYRKTSRRRNRTGATVGATRSIRKTAKARLAPFAA